MAWRRENPLREQSSEVSEEEIEGREGPASEGELTEGEEGDGDEAMEGGQLARIMTEQREDYDEDQDPEYVPPPTCLDISLDYDEVI